MSFYDDASLIMFPSGYKEDKIYSLKPTDGSGDLTFTRASTATRVNEQGLIENAFVLGSELIPTQATIVNLGGGTITQILGNSYSSTSNGASGSTLRPKFDVALTIGKKYKLIITPIGSISGVINFDLYDGTSYVFNDYDFATVKEVIFTANASSIFLAFDGTKIYSISNFTISIKEVIENNVPRIDYTGGGCGKLLLEPQRTNLVTYSSEFNNAAWAKQDSTITANAAISPDGTTNADLYTTTSDLYDFVRQSITYISGTSYTISVFVKQGTSSEISLFLPSQAFGSNQSVTFDVSDGTYTITSGSPSVTIEDYGNGWYRCALSATATISATRSTGFSSVASGAVTTLYLYGAQVEANASYATSYIPTLASSVTRLADEAYKTGISSLIGQTEGVLFFDWIMNHESPNTSEDLYTLTMSDGTGNKLIVVNNYNQTLAVLIKDTTTQFFSNAYTGGADGARIKLALGYANNDVALYINGTQIATDSSATIPTLSQIRLNTFWNGNFPDSSSVNQLLLFKTRLTNTQLAELTTI